MSEAAGTTGQHDTPQYYAVEQLRSAQSHLLELVQALVIWRAGLKIPDCGPHRRPGRL